jgi:hypothetical protein
MSPRNRPISSRISAIFLGDHKFLLKGIFVDPLKIDDSA